MRTAKRPSEIADCVGAYLAEGDLDGIVSLFHPDCVVYFPVGEAPKKGLAAVRELFVPFAQMKPKLISDVIGELVNGDTALLRANWRIEAQDGSLLAEGQSTEVTKQGADGNWLYYMDCPHGPPELEAK